MEPCTSAKNDITTEGVKAAASTSYVSMIRVDVMDALRKEDDPNPFQRGSSE